MFYNKKKIKHVFAYYSQKVYFTKNIFLKNNLCFTKTKNHSYYRKHGSCCCLFFLTTAAAVLRVFRNRRGVRSLSANRNTKKASKSRFSVRTDTRKAILSLLPRSRRCHIVNNKKSSNFRCTNSSAKKKRKRNKKNASVQLLSILCKSWCETKPHISCSGSYTCHVTVLSLTFNQSINITLSSVVWNTIQKLLYRYY